MRNAEVYCRDAACDAAVDRRTPNETEAAERGQEYPDAPTIDDVPKADLCILFDIDERPE